MEIVATEITVIDATGCATSVPREIGAGFDQALDAFEERSLAMLRELSALVERWPTDTVMSELLHRQRQELAYLMQRHSTLRYVELSRARQKQT